MVLLLLTMNEVIEIKPVKVDRVVDTTGAGDLYAGGFYLVWQKEKILLPAETMRPLQQQRLSPITALDL